MGCWTAFNGRRQSEASFQAEIFVAGQWVTKRLNGPHDFAAWKSGFRVWRFAMLVLRAAKAAAMDTYERRIEELSIKYPNHW